MYDDWGTGGLKYFVSTGNQTRSVTDDVNRLHPGKTAFEVKLLDKFNIDVLVLCGAYR